MILKTAFGRLLIAAALVLAAGCGTRQNLARDQVTFVVWYVEDIAHGLNRDDGELDAESTSVALQKVSAHWNNELGLEFRRVIGEMRLGISRVDALHHLVERTGVPEMTSFVAVLVQADRLGIAISNVLHTQSAEMRIRRRQRANEAASKAPIKMLIPLVLFIFPAVFAVILGPAIPQIMAAFK